MKYMLLCPVYVTHPFFYLIVSMIYPEQGVNTYFLFITMREREKKKRVNDIRLHFNVTIIKKHTFHNIQFHVPVITFF